MRESFDNKLKELNIKLVNMASNVEQIIAMSVKSLEEQNIKLAKETVEFDNKINESEREVERLCLNLLLQYQPVFAVDLRRVSSALKMITDMERIGDQAADIASLNISLIAKKLKWDLEDINEMARSATSMVTNSIEAFINNDEQLALEVIRSDDKIDNLFIKTKNNIIEQIVENRENAEKALDTLMVAKYFEKIGDHAVNVAEWVVFSITGVHKQSRIM
ncbi:MAG: phosphate signaling complex protein PhoU [Hominimerdicola sp.]